MKLLRWMLTLCAVAFISACGGSTPKVAKLAPGDIVLAFGDSLTYGTGAKPEASYPEVLAQLIGRNVVRAGVPGEQTAGGLARLPGLLDEHRPRLVIVCLGGNDMLRGLPPAQTRANLDQLLTRLGERKVPVVLMGMLSAPNWGTDHAAAFNAIYPELARKHSAGLVPFFLEGVALQPGLMQADGLHPTAAAQPRLLDNVWPALAPLL